MQMYLSSSCWFVNACCPHHRSHQYVGPLVQGLLVVEWVVGAGAGAGEEPPKHIFNSPSLGLVGRY